MTIIRRAAQFVLAIGVIALILLVQIEVEGAKTFAVTSTTPDGKDFISKNNVRYVANSFGMPFANLNVDTGRIAANVKEFTSWKMKTGLRFNVSYVPLSDEVVRKYALQSNLSLWDRRGGWFVLGVFLLAAFIISRPSRKTESQ